MLGVNSVAATVTTFTKVESNLCFDKIETYSGSSTLYLYNKEVRFSGNSRYATGSPLSVNLAIPTIPTTDMKTAQKIIVNNQGSIIVWND